MKPLNQGLSNIIEAHLEKFFRAHKASEPEYGLYDHLIRELEAPLLRQTLKFSKGNQIKAALILGINRNTLRTKLKNHSINPQDYDEKNQ